MDDGDDDSVVVHNGLNVETTIFEGDDNEPKIVNKIPNQPYENITGLTNYLIYFTNLVS